METTRPRRRTRKLDAVNKTNRNPDRTSQDEGKTQLHREHAYLHKNIAKLFGRHVIWSRKVREMIERFGGGFYCDWGQMCGTLFKDQVVDVGKGHLIHEQFERGESGLSLGVMIVPPMFQDRHIL